MKSLKEALVHKHMDHYKLKRGDDLENGDIVVIGYDCVDTDTIGQTYQEVNVGEYLDGDIVFNERIEGWCLYQDTFKYEEDDCIGEVIAVYKLLNNRESRKIYNNKYDDISILNDIKNDHNYVCIYENKTLVKKFGLK